MTDCPQGEIRDRLPEYVHGTLGAAERAQIEAHLAGCTACRDEVALLRGVRAGVIRRTPVVNTARVAAAVNASRAVPKTRREMDRMRGPMPQYARLAAAAALVIATGALGYLAGRVTTKPQVANGPGTIQLQHPLPAAPVTAPSASQVAVAPAPVTAPVVKPSKAAGLSFGGGVADLSAAQVNSLLGDLDRVAPVLDTDPDPDPDFGSGQ
jgi:anti-sigma factor RsiW